MISTRSLLTIVITEEHSSFVSEVFLMCLFCISVEQYSLLSSPVYVFSGRYNDGKQQFTKIKHDNQLDGIS